MVRSTFILLEGFADCFGGLRGLGKDDQGHQGSDVGEAFEEHRWNYRQLGDYLAHIGHGGGEAEKEGGAQNA